MKKYNVNFWSQYDFTKICRLFDGNDCIELTSEDFLEILEYESLTHNYAWHDLADCQTFDTMEEAKAVFEEIKSKCNIRVLTSRKIKNGIEADVRCDMCELTIEEFDEDGDLIGSESIEFYAEKLILIRE